MCTPHEVDEYKRMKCTALIRLFDFLTTMLSCGGADTFHLIPFRVWTDAFFICLVRTVLDPARVGFSLSDLDVLANLPTKTRLVLKLLSQSFPPDLNARLKRMFVHLIDERREFKTLHDYVEVIKKRAPNMQASNVQIDWLKLSQLVTGFE